MTFWVFLSEYLVGGSKESKMISSGSLYSRFIHRNHCTIRMSHQTSIGSQAIASSINSWGSSSINSTHRDRASNDGASSSIGSSPSSKVISTGSSHSWLISRDHSTIGVGHQMSVQVQGTSIAIASSIGVGRGSNSQRGSSITNLSNRGSSSIGSSLGNKVVSTSSSNSWFISRDNSSIGVSHKVSVQVERSTVAIASSIRVGRGSNSQRGSSITNLGNRCSSSIGSSFGNKVVSTGSNNSWLISRNHSSIRVGHQMSVKVERSTVAITSSIGVGRGSNSQRSSSITNLSYRGSRSKRSSSITNLSYWGSSKRSRDDSWASSKLGGKMISTGSCYSWLISRNYCSIGMSNQAEETLGCGN